MNRIIEAFSDFNWDLLLRFLQVLAIPGAVFLYDCLQRRARRKALAAQLRFELDQNIHIAEGSIEFYQRHIDDFQREGKDPQIDPVLAPKPTGWRSAVFDVYRFEASNLWGPSAGEALQKAYDKIFYDLWKGDDQIPPVKAKEAFEDVVKLLQEARQALPKRP